MKTLVQVIRKKNKSALVQWRADNGSLLRGTIPSAEIDGENTETFVEPAVLEMAVPYGVAWSDFLQDVLIPAEKIEQALHSAGVWTVDDMRLNPASVNSAIVSLVNINLVQLMRQAEQGAETLEV